MRRILTQYECVIWEGSSVQQEAAPSSEVPISGAPACDRLHPIIFGRSQIDPTLTSAVHGCVFNKSIHA
jgi:hypothetical protein